MRMMGVIYKDNVMMMSKNPLMKQDVFIYKENNKFLRSFFLIGIWYEIFILVGVFVGIVDGYSKSLPLASLVGLGLAYFLIWLRCELGINNLVKNNKIDKRFLI